MHILCERLWVGYEWRESSLEVQVMVSMFVLQPGNASTSRARR